MRLSPQTTLRLISFWPPYLAAGIKVVEQNRDLSRVTISLRLRPWNKNYFGTHFGGSLYAMCDPFLVFLYLHQLGPEFIVWDKAACIEFVKAVSEPVFVTFTVDEERVQEIRRTTLKQFSIDAEFQAEVVTAEGEIVARVLKTLYIRRKDAKSRFSNSAESV